MILGAPCTKIALQVTVVPMPILDHLSPLTACLGLAIECKLLDLALNSLGLANLQS